MAAGATAMACARAHVSPGGVPPSNTRAEGGLPRTRAAQGGEEGEGEGGLRTQWYGRVYRVLCAGAWRP